MKLTSLTLVTAFALTAPLQAMAADLKVGFITALSGPNASVGLPYSNGMKAANLLMPKAGGRDVKLIVLDDASDPSMAARNARKLIDEEKVDVLISGSGVPGAMAIAAVARESKIPLLTLSPVSIAPEERGWTLAMTQPPNLMVAAVLEQMKRTGVKTVGFMGFSDSWGDLVYSELTKGAEGAGIKVTSNERYARADTSATGQALKVTVSRPDAVLGGTAGAAGALAYIALAERGYKGVIYGTHGVVNSEFVKVGGAALEGLLVPTGAVVVADQLPASNPIRQVALAFRDAFQKVTGAPPTDGFSGYAFDAWAMIADAARRAGNGEPGSAAYRTALRDALMSTNELVGVHGVYNFKPGQLYGVDERSRVMVKLEKGKWVYMP